MSRLCEGSHCSQRSAELNNFCIQIYQGAPGGPGGKPVASQDRHGPCYCTCSCVALDTLVWINSDEYKSIDSIKTGELVMTADTNFHWELGDVKFSDGTGPDATQNDAVFVEFEGGSIVTTSDHLFLLSSRRLRRADRLSPDDKLVNASGEELKLTALPKIGYFKGGFHNISISKNDPNGSLDRHLILTGGVVSADYTIQLYQEQFLDEEDEKLPVIGTNEYEEKWNIVYDNVSNINDRDTISNIS